MFSEDIVDIKQEPPDEVDEDLASILNSEVHLTEVDNEDNGDVNIIASNVTELLSGKKETVTENNINSCGLKAYLKCKFSFCTFRARNISALERHEAKHSIPGSYYECRFCKFMTPVHQRLEEHEAKHTNTKPFKCTKCNYRSRYRADIYHHSAKHLKEKKFKCPNDGCSFVTKWRRNIHHHILTHTDDRPHECNICDYKFKRLQDLKYHLYRHNDEKPITCDQCDFRCKTNYELGCHKLKHSSVRNFACTFPGCQQRTKTKSDLTKHIKTHNKTLDYLCPVCGKGFHVRNSLTKHMERHQDARNYKCGLCAKSFKTKATLRSHMQVHSGVKPWTCDICFHNFLNKWNMIKHKETHGENRPFKCPICPYGARVGEHLLAHIGTMHGKNFAYFCEICKKPWRRFSQLQIHMKRMHKGALRSSFGSSMKMDIKLEPGVDGDIETGCDLISVKKIDTTNMKQFKQKRGRPRKIKQEPIDHDDAEVSKAEGEGHEDPVTAVVESLVSHQNEPPTTSDIPLPVQTKHEVPSDVGPAKIVCFGEFRLPLATKGFPFNYDKNGKKPNSWFMNPENMYGKAADRQKAYLEKKERDFERCYGRKLGWRRLRLRKKPKPGISHTKAIDKEERDETDIKPKMEERKEVTNNDNVKEKKNETEKNIKPNIKQDPMELLIQGRKKLILMRKIKRRQKRWKERMAKIMQDDDDEFPDEESKEPDISNVPDPSEQPDNWIKPDDPQELADQQAQDSSDQEDDIPLSKLKNTEDLDDLPLSLLRTKEPGLKDTSNGNLEKQHQTQQAKATFSGSTECLVSKVPPKQRRKYKRRVENSASDKKIKSKKRKQEKSSGAVENNFYNGSVRILSKTLIAESHNNDSHVEKKEYSEVSCKDTISYTPTIKSDLSRNGSLSKLKGKKIENIIAKLKAKKFGTEITTEVNFQGKLKKKVGRPKGSKNKMRKNLDTESKAYKSASQKTMAVVTGQNILIKTKARKGRPKGSKNKVKTDKFKNSVLKTEQPNTLKEQNVKNNASSEKSTCELDASVNPVGLQLREPECFINIGNGFSSCTKMQANNDKSDIKVRKVGRPKGSKTGVNRKGCKKTKPNVSKFPQKKYLKKYKQVDSKIKPTGSIMTLQSGKVYELKPGNVWDLSENINNTKEKCTKSTQTLVQDKTTKIQQSQNIIPKTTKKSTKFLSGKCQPAINVQLKKKLLDKISKQKTEARVLSEVTDPVLSISDTNQSLLNLPPKKKVGRPKGSKNKVGNKVLTSAFQHKDVKKLKIKKQTLSEKMNKTGKVKVIKRAIDEAFNKYQPTNKKTKMYSNKKKVTSLKVTKVKRKYNKQFKNSEKGFKKILKSNGKAKKSLKMKSTKGKKVISQTTKRKKLVCSIGSKTAQNKNVKQKSTQQIWYIDIERESADEMAISRPFVKSELANDILLQMNPAVSLEADKSLLASIMLTQAHHYQYVTVKPEPQEDLVKSEPVLPEFPPGPSYTMAAEEAEDISVYREHAQAWGVRKEANPQTSEDLEQLPSELIGTQGDAEQDTESRCAPAKDVVGLPAVKQTVIKMSQSGYQEADMDSQVEHSHSEITNIMKNGDAVIQHSNFSRADKENDGAVLSGDHFNVDNNSCGFSALESHVENNGPLLSQLNSNTLVSNQENTNNSQLNSQMENEGFGLPSSQVNPKLVNMENDNLVINLSDSQIQSNISCSPMSGDEIISPNSHKEILSNSTKTDDPDVNLMLTKMEGQMVVLGNGDYSTIGSGCNDEQQDNPVTTYLYSQVIEKGNTPETVASEYKITEDIIAHSSFDQTHPEDEIHVEKSPNEGLSYKVVLADLNTEQHCVGDVDIFKPTIKTEMGYLPFDCDRMSMSESVNYGSYDFNAVDSDIQQKYGVIDCNESKSGSEVYARKDTVVEIVVPDTDGVSVRSESGYSGCVTSCDDGTDNSEVNVRKNESVKYLIPDTDMAQGDSSQNGSGYSDCVLNCNNDPETNIRKDEPFVLVETYMYDTGNG